MFDPPKRSSFRGNYSFINPNHAILQRLTHTEGSSDISSVDVRCQPRRRIIGPSYSFIFLRKRYDRCNGAERLFFSENRALRGMSDDGWLDEISVSSRNTRTSCSHGRPRINCLLDVRKSFFESLLIDQRALTDTFLEAMSYFEASHQRHEFCQKLLQHRLMDQYTVCANTGLARVSELACEGANSCCFDISIFKDDERSISSKFQRQPLHCIGAICS
mmetsp:Transcript_24520/g.39526  ORF Transcript_24520/g.39526 Transcript_24520/m.39526 type:complete len:218 (-) Transcript_24520:599-1252(-)